MKKQLTALFTATLLLTSLTGCTNENSSTANNSSVVDTNSAVTSDNTESAESDTSAETSDLTQSLPKAVEIGDKMILTGTLLKPSQLEEFSVETLVSNYTLSAEEEDILDSVGVPEIKDLYITAVVLSDFSKNPEKFQTSATTANNRTPATIVNTRFPKRYYQTGYTYESVYNEYLKAFEGGEGESFFKVDFCIEYNKEFLCAKASDEVEKREVHKEYKIAYQDDSYIKIRKTSFSYDKNLKPATEYKPELRYEYDITVTEYMFDLTENGWQVKKPVSSKINDKSVDDVIYDEALYISVFGDSVFDSVVDITPENDWVVDAFMAEAKKYEEKVLNPDGSAFEPEKAVRVSGNKNSVSLLGFDYAYIFYTKPYCITSIDNTREDIENKKTTMQPLNYSDMIKIKAGDVLDNGLKVTTAEYTQNIGSSGYLEYCHSQWIKFEGELTLNGYFVYSPSNEVHSEPESVYFIADSANDCMLPTLEAEPYYGWYDDSGNLSMTEGLRIRNSETNRPETLDKFPDNLRESKIIKVKATIKDPILGAQKCSAELVSYEVLN